MLLNYAPAWAIFVAERRLERLYCKIGKETENHQGFHTLTHSLPARQDRVVQKGINQTTGQKSE